MEEIAELEQERLTVDGQVLINKCNGKTHYQAIELPIMDKFKSLIHLLREDPALKTIYQSLCSVVIVPNADALHTQTDYIPRYSYIQIDKMTAYF